MKKFTHMVVFLVGLTIVSCSKQTVTPTQDSDQSSVPVWRSASVGGVVVLGGDDTDTEGSSITDPNDKEVVTDVNGNEITDPNDKDKHGRRIN